MALLRRQELNSHLLPQSFIYCYYCVQVKYPSFSCFFNSWFCEVRKYQIIIESREKSLFTTKSCKSCHKMYCYFGVNYNLKGCSVWGLLSSFALDYFVFGQKNSTFISILYKRHLWLNIYTKTKSDTFVPLGRGCL